MNELQIFENQEFGKIRTIVKDGEPWFVAKDVGDALEIENVRQNLQAFPDNEKGVCTIYTLGGNQDMLSVNEPGFYRLVFQSRKIGAEKFKTWVLSEVLPSIRKHGMYATAELLDNPDFAIEVFKKLKDERQARIAAENKNAILMHVKKTYTVTEIAKELGFRSAMELNELLGQKKIQFKMNDTWVPTAEYAELGYFIIKQEVLDSGKVIYHRRITQLGRDFILGLFVKETCEVE